MPDRKFSSGLSSSSKLAAGYPRVLPDAVQLFLRHVMHGSMWAVYVYIYIEINIDIYVCVNIHARGGLL